MERRLRLTASLALAVCLLGCASERRPEQARPSDSAASEEHPGRHVVVRPLDPVPTTDALPSRDTAPPFEPTASAPPETYLPQPGIGPTFEPGPAAPSEVASDLNPEPRPANDSVDSNILPPQSGDSQPLAIEAQFDRALNPLRSELAPAPSRQPLPQRVNPLRSLSVLPEMANAPQASYPQVASPPVATPRDAISGVPAPRQAADSTTPTPESPLAAPSASNNFPAAASPAADLWPEAYSEAALRRGSTPPAAEPAATAPQVAESSADSPLLPESAEPPTASVLPTPATPAAPRKTLQSLSGLGPFPAKPESPAAAALPYDTVQVFYGTNRAAVDLTRRSAPEQVARWMPTAVAALITVALAMLAIAKGRSSALVLASLGLVASLGLAYQAASRSLYEARRGEHVGPKYTADRAPGGRVELGLCEVTIPRSHTVGELEAPSILRMEVRSDASKHVILSKTEPLADERFYELLRERVAASPRKEIFVFVHGFNVTFEDAARRAGQMHHDLKYQGVPVFFSWPAHDKFVLTYTADANNVSWSASHLKQFLLDITHRSDAQAVNLIAHSMGNRALTAALKELHLELRDQSRLFNQVILAAPDIDADEFRHSIAPALAGTANRITLYASSRDEALAASQLVHRGPRAGDAGRGLVVVPGIDTIDVSPIDSSPWGHTYYGSSDPVLRDLGMLITGSTPPEQRTWLAPAELEGQPYWIFQPPAATARVPRPDTTLPAQR
jgi:esterase/lipase superfamily enzyme